LRGSPKQMAFRLTTSIVRTPRYLNLSFLMLTITLVLGVVHTAGHVVPASKASPNGVGVPPPLAEIAVEAFDVKIDAEGGSQNSIGSEGRMELPSKAPTSRGATHVRTTPRVQRLSNKPETPKVPSTSQETSDTCTGPRPLVVESPLTWLGSTLFEELLLLLVCAPFAVCFFKGPLGDQARSKFKRLRKQKQADSASESCAKDSGPSTTLNDMGVDPTNVDDKKVVAYNQIITSCIRAGDVARAEEWLLRQLESGTKPEVSSFNMVIDACTKNKRMASGERWLLAMIDAGVAPDVISYTTIIDACAKNGDVLRAERWLTKMLQTGVNADVVSYNAVIDACAKAGEVRHAEQWFSKMVSTGVEPNVISYTALIAASARHGDLARAEALLEKMEQNGVKANANSYSAVIDCCAKTGNVGSAEKWLSRMTKAGVDADVVCYNALINACAKAGNAERAEEWLSKMLDRGLDVNVISYNAVINACAKARDVDRAERWLKQMLQKGVEVNVICYNAVINACARVGDVTRAERWLCELASAGIDADAISYNAVIDACAKAGDATRAQGIFSKMQTAGVTPTVVTYTSLATPLSKQGEWEAVERIMDEMVASGLTLNSYFLNILLCAYGNSSPKQATKAEQAFRDAIHEGIEVNEFIVNSLKKCLGGSRSLALVRGLGLSPPAPSTPSATRRLPAKSTANSRSGARNGPATA